MPDADQTHAEDWDACAATLRQGSRSFAAAARLLPTAPRRHAVALYAFCRIADDLIDSATQATIAPTLAALHTRLDHACAGRPDDTPIDRAFAATLAACAIPAALPQALLDGFAWDAERRRYPDLPALRRYAARVAGTVGAMMALTLGVRDEHALARACDLGVAMQLTNIARDVGEDARAGRLYLPLDWLHQAGIAPDAFLANPTHTQPLATIVARLLAEAERLYASAEPGIALLPARTRPAIRAAARLYRGIGRELAHTGHNAIDRRTTLPFPTRAALVATSLAGRRNPTDAPPLEETAYLIRALPRLQPRLNPLVWTLELFARLDQRDRLRSSG